MFITWRYSCAKNNTNSTAAHVEVLIVFSGGDVIIDCYFLKYEQFIVLDCVWAEDT